MLHRTTVSLALAAALAMGSAAAARPPAADAPAGGSAGAPRTPDAKTQKAFNQALGATERRIQASPTESQALADAVYKKDEKGIRRVLVRNGFPEALLAQSTIASKGEGPAAKGLKIKIKFEGECCPFRIVITIGFR